MKVVARYPIRSLGIPLNSPVIRNNFATGNRDLMAKGSQLVQFAYHR